MFEKKNELFVFNTAFVAEGMIYFVYEEYAALLCMNQNGENIRYISTIPYKNFRIGGVVRNLILWKDSVWIFQDYSREIYIYNLIAAHWDMIKPGIFDEDVILPFLGVQIEGIFFGIEKGINKIIKVDLDKRQIDVKNTRKDNGKSSLFRNAQITEVCCAGKSIFAVDKNNYIVEYKFGENDVRYHKVGEKNDKFITICYDGAFFWIFEKNGSVLKWDRNSGECRRVKMDTKDIEKCGNLHFRSSLCRDGYVWLFSSSSMKNIKVNCDVFDFDVTYSFSGRQKLKKTRWSTVIENDVCFIDAERKLFVKHASEGRVEKLLEIQPEERSKMLYAYLRTFWEKSDGSGVLIESNRIDFDDFVEFIYDSQHTEMKS